MMRGHPAGVHPSHAPTTRRLLGPVASVGPTGPAAGRPLAPTAFAGETSHHEIPRFHQGAELSVAHSTVERRPAAAGVGTSIGGPR